MIEDFGDGFWLRQATAEDREALGRICLLTGAAGEDASAREDDPRLLGYIYAVPYQVLEPDFAFVVDGPEGVCGYVLGALDTVRFNERLVNEWLVTLRPTVPDPGPDPASWRGSDWARRLIHHPDTEVPAILDPYPSHGHIDLLPTLQGRGVGRKLMSLMEKRLKAAGSVGLHLGVDPRNRNARKFYKAIGFKEVEIPRGNRRAVYMVKAF